MKPRKRTHRRRRDDAPRSRPYWLHGRHAVTAALANPARRARQLWLLDGTAPPPNPAGVPTRQVDPATFAQTEPRDAPHQGLALELEPFGERKLATVLAGPVARDARILLLDRVGDPRNVGALIRSAAAFGALAVIAPRRHAPAESASMARAAAGGLERVPYLRVANLARTLAWLAERGFWRVGLEADAEAAIETVPRDQPLALVLGAEADGARRLTAEACDFQVRLPIAPGIESLNVSVAGAIALYALRPAPGRASDIAP